jgi:hypothetical protein
MGSLTSVGWRWQGLLPGTLPPGASYLTTTRPVILPG